jgi:hypothetical protein
MSVTLEKASDSSIFGGHNSRTSYTKTRRGTIPEYVLFSRRRAMCGFRIDWDQSDELRENNLSVLSMFFGGRL